VYTYFRYNEESTVMVIMNCTGEEKEVLMDRFAERTMGFSGMKNVETGQESALKNEVTLAPWTTTIFELTR
ncbi:MAG: cyclomaltodextrinase C-terminal domain-containing protein, partial [Bacteroidota bacterium]